eukprot:m.121242 g.121242  ORF g.121242 m.121242 type:complete len:55 (-) comp15631_c0_seq7:1782-1946(-)
MYEDNYAVASIGPSSSLAFLLLPGLLLPLRLPSGVVSGLALASASALDQGSIAI